LERQIGRLHDTKSEQTAAGEFHRRADARRAAMDKYFWNDEAGAFFDYDWQLEQQRENLTAATVVPLFVRFVSPSQAQRVADTVERRLPAPGGISTTEVSGSGQQWDRPNGWAPLHWMAIRGLVNYQHFELAAQIRERWLMIVSELYESE